MSHDECNCRQCNGTLEPDYPEECPDSCASMQEPTECGECEELMEECVCWIYGTWACYGIGFWATWGWRLCNVLRRMEWVKGFRGPSKTPAAAAECDCPSPAEIRADRAEARAEAREDR